MLVILATWETEIGSWPGQKCENISEKQTKAKRTGRNGSSDRALA
jgi:hypothetical protein